MSFRLWLKKILFGSLVAGACMLTIALCATFCAWFYLKSVVQGEVVSVPNLFGKTAEEARRITDDLDLELLLNETQVVHDNFVEKDKVLLQIPRANRKIKTRRLIEITLSAGPEEKLIPDLENQTLSFSEVLLEEAGTQASILSRTPSDAVARGKIIKQIPMPGEEIGLREGLSLLVSDGPQDTWYVTPNFLGRDYLTVKAFLEGAEIRAITKYRVEEEDLGQTILEQIPKPGYPISKTGTITLIVNKDF